MKTLNTYFIFNDSEKFIKKNLKPLREKLPKAGKSEIFAYNGSVFYVLNSGKREKFSISHLQEKLSEVYSKAKSLSLKRVVLKGDFIGVEFSPEFEITYFWNILNYRFSKKSKPEKEIKLKYKKDSSGELLSGIVNSSRELVNMSPSELNPDTFESFIKEEFSELKVEVLYEDKLHEIGMGGILSVGRGASKKPRLIILEYRPEGFRKSIALVGKTVTFDSGGYNLKPGSAMLDMKIDMAGGATVLGILKAVKEFGLKLRVKAYLPVVENLINEVAYKPGDVIKMYNGKTVEIRNTDAEGRLILADALSYADEEKFDYLFDYATLTGAAIIALGNEISALMSYNDSLSKRLMELFSKYNEPLWRLPMPEFYRKDVESEIADLKNASYGNGGGTLKAGIFLSNFIKRNRRVWAHFDIAGPSHFMKKNRLSISGATGFGIRGTFEFLKKVC